MQHMYIDGVEIKLDPQKNYVDYEENDWAIDVAEHTMRHMPTKVTFRIEMDEEAQKAGAGTIFNFLARPIHICSGNTLPLSPELTELGRAAIVLYLYGSGLLKPERPVPARHTGEPDLNVN